MNKKQKVDMFGYQKLIQTNLTLDPSQPSSLNYEVYCHSQTQLQVIFLDSLGPITNLTILVPTLCKDNFGLPHTLEHLIFCGSQNYPQRGYLEALATQSLSTGTNAWTDSDHTAYTFNSVGSQGLLNTLPVFLDHVLYPTLSQNDFSTEVYHLDGQAKSQGVVYSEMAARQFTEGDLVDLSLKRLIYQNSTTYAYECGGLTQDIEKLTNQQIIQYHQQFYKLNNISIIVAGKNLSRESVLQSLNRSQFLNRRDGVVGEEVALKLTFPEPVELLDTKTVEFPSEDEGFGSVNYAWRGPLYSDFPTSLALEIVLYYLTDSPNAILQQHFVNLASPLANDVSYDFKLTPETSLWLHFSGVPNDPTKSWLEPGLFRAKFLLVLTQAVDTLKLESVQDAVDRFLKNQLQSLEEASADTLTESIIPALLAQKFSKIDLVDSIKHLGNRFEVLRQLKLKDLDFWKGLVTKYLLESAPGEVIATPNSKLGSKLQKEKDLKQKSLANKLGKVRLQAIQEEVDSIVKSNRIDSEQFDPIPDANILDIPNLKLQQAVVENTNESTNKLFDRVDLVHTETQFVNLLVGFPTFAIASELKPYLVLLQALLFQTDLVPLDSTQPIISFESAVEKSNRITLERYCHLGLGGSYFSLDRLPEFFFLGCKTSLETFALASQWMFHNLLLAQFGKSRILSVAQNLATELEELFRSGNDLLNLCTNRVTFQGYSLAHQRSLHRATSAFQQEEFLNDLVDSLNHDSEGKNLLRVVACLVKLRDSIVLSYQNGGYVQLGLPITGVDPEKLLANVKQGMDTVLQAYRPSFKDTLFTSHPQTNLKSVLRPNYRHPKPSKSLTYHLHSIVSVQAITASYLTLIVPCDTLDNFEAMVQVQLLNELLTRSNGPLFELIRGQGLAYHVDLRHDAWKSTLALTLTEIVNPVQTLKVLHQFFQELATDWEQVVTEKELQFAKASLTYVSTTSMDSPTSVLNSCLKYSFWGYETLQFVERYRKSIQRTTTIDLKNCFTRFFQHFFQPQKAQVVLLVPSSKQDEEVSEDEVEPVDGDEGGNEEQLHLMVLELNQSLGLEFQVTKLDQF